MTQKRPRATVRKLQEAGQAMADFLHGPYAECAQCNLAHAHLPGCIIGEWLRAGGNTVFTENVK